MTIDPTDDCTFWYTGTYYPATGNATNWHTRIGAFRFANCSPSTTAASYSASSPNSAAVKRH